MRIVQDLYGQWHFAKPGDHVIVDSRFGKVVQHSGFVYDNGGQDGAPRVAHNAKEHGALLDTWEGFAQGGAVRLVRTSHPDRLADMQHCARWYLPGGQGWQPYHATLWNCDQFVKAIFREPISSQQLREAWVAAYAVFVEFSDLPAEIKDNAKRSIRQSLLGDATPYGPLAATDAALAQARAQAAANAQRQLPAAKPAPTRPRKPPSGPRR